MFPVGSEKRKRSKRRKKKGTNRIETSGVARKSNFLGVLLPPALIFPFLTRSTILTPIFFFLSPFSFPLFFQVFCSSIEPVLRSIRSMRGNVPKSKSSEIYAHVPRERQTRFVHSSQDGTLFEKTARLIGNVRSSTDRATVIESKDTRFGNDSTNFADKNVDAKVEGGAR